jgi:hypothetical protein
MTSTGGGKRGRDDASAGDSGGGSALAWDPSSMLLVGIPQTALLLSHAAELDADPSAATRLLAALAREEAAAHAAAAAARQAFIHGRYASAAAEHAVLQALPSVLEREAAADVAAAVAAARAAGAGDVDPSARLAEWGVAPSAAALAAIHAAVSGAGGSASDGGRSSSGRGRGGVDDGAVAAASGESMQVDGDGAGGGEQQQQQQAAQRSSSPAPLPQYEQGPPYTVGAGDEEPLYHGRPVRGATSATMYVAAEWATGAPPPPQRDGWRYLVGEGADGLPRVDLGGGGGGSTDGGGSSRVLDPALIAQAHEALKRPAFPDRVMPPPRTGAGSLAVRGVALAADFDEAAAQEARAHEATATVLAQLAARG